jgi:exodeoxyribonuclease VII small subunit
VLTVNISLHYGLLAGTLIHLMTENKPSFENSLKELEQIVKKLEQGHTTLDESIKLYEKGKHLEKSCRAMIENAKLRVEKVVSQQSDGSVIKEDFITS